jgi:hypothetical protein
MICLFLSVVTIFFAVYLAKAELPSWMAYILVAFVAFDVIMHLILSVSLVYFKTIVKIKNYRIWTSTSGEGWR